MEVSKRFENREIKSLTENLVGHNPYVVQVFLGFVVAGFTVYFCPSYRSTALLCPLGCALPLLNLPQSVHLHDFTCSPAPVFPVPSSNIINHFTKTNLILIPCKYLGKYPNPEKMLDLLRRLPQWQGCFSENICIQGLLEWKEITEWVKAGNCQVGTADVLTDLHQTWSQPHTASCIHLEQHLCKAAISS